MFPEKVKPRYDYALRELTKLGYKVKSICGGLEFIHKGSPVKIYTYKGWFTGKTVKDGRGIANLLKQLKQ